MSKIYMVRHGKAASGFGAHLDPGLDDLGQIQAEATAQVLAPLGPMPVLSSPLARALETAQPLAALWQTEIRIEPRVAEIPSPTSDLAERVAWLQEIMPGRWSDLNADLQNWRQALVSCLLEQTQDSVVFCHFIAINVAVGAAQDDDRIVIFSPDNGSVTVLSTDGGRLAVVNLGNTAATQVN